MKWKQIVLCIINLENNSASRWHLCFEGAAYLHRCLKIEAADDIRTHDSHNFQNEYLERFLSNLLFLAQSVTCSFLCTLAIYNPKPDIH